MASVYTSKTYRDFMRDELDSNRFGRGARSRLAEFLGAKSSHLSLVLSGKQDFGLEYGIKIANFFNLDENETDWLLLMLARDRAGTPELKLHYQKQMNAIEAKRSDIQNRLKTQDTPDAEDLTEYYNAWYHVPVHVCLLNPELRTPEDIAKYLGITRENASQSLSILEKLGFAQNNKGKWKHTAARFHLAQTSPALRMHHINCRNTAIRSFDHARKEDLHYSLVMSADAESVAKLNEAILDTIQNFEPVLANAKDEAIYSFTVDLFRLGKTDRI